MSTTTPKRRPYTGSCHCGLIKYIAHITLPPPLITADKVSPSSTTRIRKCNCSICHKASWFHVRLMDSPNDFQVLSPLTATGLDVSEKGLGDYTCFAGNVHWYFCSKCGVRCFNFMGKGEIVDVDVAGETKTVWKPKEEGWKEGATSTGYLSVNATSLDQGQEGCDLREWTEKGWIVYLDCLKEIEEDRLGKPHEGGMY